MKTSYATVLLAVSIAAMLAACAPDKPPEALRSVRTAEVRYDKAQETNRYTGIVQARHEVDHAFRVGGKIMVRKIDVGQTVREGDVLAVLDETDYRLAEEAARAAAARRPDGGAAGRVGPAAQSGADRRRRRQHRRGPSTRKAGRSTPRRRPRPPRGKLELARNRLEYTVLRASRSGVVTAMRAEAGRSSPKGSRSSRSANPGEPEVVVDVPEDQLASFTTARYRASLAAAPTRTFDVACASSRRRRRAQTRTYRARLKPVTPRPLPLGATATLVAERTAEEGGGGTDSGRCDHAEQAAGRRCGSFAARVAEPVGTVELISVAVHGYRNDEVLVSGLPAGELVVTAGVQKMAPGLKVALAASRRSEASKQVAR